MRAYPPTHLGRRAEVVQRQGRRAVAPAARSAAERLAQVQNRPRSRRPILHLPPAP
jgi:hypothetical protein